MNTLRVQEPWEEEDRLLAGAGEVDRDLSAMIPTELRGGFVFDERGRARPWLANALAAGQCPLVGYPDAAVEGALRRGDRAAARALLLESPARRCMREADRLLTVPVPWPRLRQAAGAHPPTPGDLAPASLLGVWVLDTPWAGLDALRSVTDRWTTAAINAAVAAMDARPPHSSWMEAWARAVNAAWVLAPEGTGEQDLLAVGSWIVRVYAENPLVGADPDLITAALDRLLPERRGQPPLLVADAWESALRLPATYLLGGMTQLVDRCGLPSALLPRVREIACTRARSEVRGSLGRAPERDLPLVARWLQHRAREPWYEQLPDAARRETLTTLGAALASEDGLRATWLLAGLGRALADGLPAGRYERETWERSIELGSGLGPHGMGQLWRVGLLLPGAADRLTRRAGALADLLRALPTDWRVPILFEALDVSELAESAAAELSRLAAADDRAAAMALLTRAKTRALPRVWLDNLAASLPPSLRRDPIVTGELEDARRRAG